MPTYVLPVELTRKGYTTVARDNRTLWNLIWAGWSVRADAVVEPELAGDVDTATIKKYIDDALLAHRTSSAPHPAHDDIPSLSVIFENRIL